MTRRTKDAPEGGGAFRRQMQRRRWEVRLALRGKGEKRISSDDLPALKAYRDEVGRLYAPARSALDIERQINAGISPPG